MSERWLPVIGYEGCYDISSHGRVRSALRTLTRKNGRLTTIKERILLASPNGGGYLQINLRRLGTSKPGRIHRMVAEAFVPREPGRDHVNHINGDKTRNWDINLEWCTHAENMQHARATGLDPTHKDRPVEAFDLKTGELLLSCKSIAAVKPLGYTKSAVNLVCRGVRPTHKGLGWRFSTEQVGGALLPERRAA